jgi:hypothetical protein
VACRRSAETPHAKPRGPHAGPGLLAGTDPDNPGYWGAITDYDQRIVEASDVALGLWLGRETLWAALSIEQRQRVAAWLTGALDRQVHDGNWLLFPQVIYQVLKALQHDVARWAPRIESEWAFFKSFYRGNGWFEDPPNGFDYYNAWSIHYALFWLQQIDRAFDPIFISDTHAHFVRFYKHLFGPHGHPIMGRSVCYRMAAPVPLLTAQILAPTAVSAGEAMRALDVTWSWFGTHGALSEGRITHGLCATNLAVQAAYSGPASCLWALRSLVVAYFLAPQLDLWNIQRAPLPVERDDFVVNDPVSLWSIRGEKATGHITLSLMRNRSNPPAPLQPYGFVARAKEWLVHAPRRPNNHAALYNRAQYSTREPVLACPRSP